MPYFIYWLIVSYDHNKMIIVVASTPKIMSGGTLIVIMQQNVMVAHSNAANAFAALLHTVPTNFRALEDYSKVSTI